MRVQVSVTSYSPAEGFLICFISSLLFHVGIIIAILIFSLNLMPVSVILALSSAHLIIVLTLLTSLIGIIPRSSFWVGIGISVSVIVYRLDCRHITEKQKNC